MVRMTDVSDDSLIDWLLDNKTGKERTEGKEWM